MTESYIERELKFDVEPTFIVPDIDALLPAGGRSERRSEQLRSEYFDTADRALLTARTTLRRRSGSTDVGWQLKVPHESFREEIRVNGADHEGVPDELAELLLGVTRGQSLRRIATLSTDRSVTRLLDAGGTLLAEIDDDSVHASSGGDTATASSWREVEVELGGDDVEFLHRVGKVLRRGGARASASTSKLARALPQVPTPAHPERRAGAAAVLAPYIAEQQRMILSGDLALRRGNDDVIHRTRVATRRLRSAVRVFGPLFDASRASALDGELRWLAALMGEVRDRQVLRLRLDAMIEALDDTVLLGPVRARVETELRQEQAEHWATLQQELTSERYLALLGEVEDWVRHPPLTTVGEGPAKVVAKLAEKAVHTVTRRLERANRTGDIHQLHGARKAAKRARYAAEAATVVTGAEAAGKQAARYEELQDLLGEHQDSLVSAELLRRLGAKAGGIVGENGFAFGILYEREMQNARRARVQAQRTAKKYAR